ncbi:MAG TPA: hypothetical protein VJH04_02010 [archaeon]|nr:hypothetical protein [archaeon]
MKGISPLIASVMLIVITVAVSTLLSGWLSTTTTSQTRNIQNTTQTHLQCQYADLYIKNATYTCNNNCTTGTQHTTSITVVNSGKKTLAIDSIYIRNTTGIVTLLSLNETKTLNVGDALVVSNTTRATCTGINRSIELITVSSLNCPSTAYDSLEGPEVVYSSCG